MKYMIVLVMVLAAGFFFMNYSSQGLPNDKVTMSTMTQDEQKSVETAVKETVKYYKKYNENLKNKISIMTINDQASYQRVLSSKYHLSDNAAQLVSAGRGFYTGDTIFINTKAANTDLLRIATIAHELTHHYQQQMAPGTARLQWLQEGMADAAACNILEQSREAQIQPLPVKQLKLPIELDLAKLGTDEEWVDAVNEYGANAVYAYSALAVRRLISQKDFQSFMYYYQELNRTHNTSESFKKAFGMELSEFQDNFNKYVQSDKENIYYYNYYR